VGGDFWQSHGPSENPSYQCGPARAKERPPEVKKYDQISSLIWLLFALYICIESLRLPLGSMREPGAGFLPLGSGLCLGVLSAIVYFQARFRKKEDVRRSWYSKERWKSLLIILAVLFAYSLLLEFLGFLVSTFILLLMLFRLAQPRRWVVAVGGSALASILSYMVFEVWLKTQLPKGILGF
jgi:putative tricarboxylic transport membrane protein